MIYWTIFFGAAASLVSFLPGMFAKGSTEVELRFLERGNAFSAETLASWISANPEAARAYAFPILLGFDLLFLLCLGCFLSLGSLLAAGAAQWPGALQWAVVILPIVFMMADATEDLTLARFLLTPETIDAAAVAFVQKVTQVKIYACGAAMAQTAALSFYAALFK
ncbi:hypothetical protein LG047_06270 [Methylocystis sp. WRRC1]|uniref:hypothetical protein n=1 Tax=Methylocystis sp. WRRC1 TaxID=1732014 RepID=UPI001D1489C2|nr:hypothetical protein [Methylocystis sp. WRRC1]MCC3244928.1 hypothetical protein [Methylocystis sp. WRRC1]